MNYGSVSNRTDTHILKMKLYTIKEVRNELKSGIAFADDVNLDNTFCIKFWGTEPIVRFVKAEDVLKLTETLKDEELKQLEKCLFGWWKFDHDDHDCPDENGEYISLIDFGFDGDNPKLPTREHLVLCLCTPARGGFLIYKK